MGQFGASRREERRGRYRFEASCFQSLLLLAHNCILAVDGRASRATVRVGRLRGLPAHGARRDRRLFCFYLFKLKFKNIDIGCGRKQHGDLGLAGLVMCR